MNFLAHFHSLNSQKLCGKVVFFQIHIDSKVNSLFAVEVNRPVFSLFISGTQVKTQPFSKLSFFY